MSKDPFYKFDKKTASLLDKISRRAGTAIVDYGMIKEGDKILVGVSGGKDSLTLLNVMLHRRAIAPIDFDIMAIHIDSGIPGTKVDKLEDYFQELGVPYHVERTGFFKEKDLKDLNCFWCSWNRRKALFQYATKNGFSKIALAHHMDDIVESILMNQFFKGEVSAMCPNQEMFKGKLAIIRPFCYERESMIIDFVNSAGLTGFESCRCPVSITSQRTHIKKILRELEKVSPAVVKNVFYSLKNIKEEYLP